MEKYAIANYEVTPCTYGEYYAKIDNDKPSHGPEVPGYEFKAQLPHGWIAGYLYNEINPRLIGFSDNVDDITDGYHSFSELYEHRHMLFSYLCADPRRQSWKSLKHHDGTMYDGYFIAGVDLNDVKINYHLPMKYFSKFPALEIPNAPLWDGKSSADYLGQMRDDLYGAPLFGSDSKACEYQYDKSIHKTGDAKVWADEFFKVFPNCNVEKEIIHGWIANAMEAKYDQLTSDSLEPNLRKRMV